LGEGRIVSMGVAIGVLVALATAVVG